MTTLSVGEPVAHDGIVARGPRHGDLLCFLEEESIAMPQKDWIIAFLCAFLRLFAAILVPLSSSTSIALPMMPRVNYS